MPDARRSSHVLAALLGALAAGLPARLAAEPLVAVLSSEVEPYRAALRGLEAGVGHPVPALSAAAGDPRLPADARVVVAIGSRAAQAAYPDHVTVVFCMAPATRVQDVRHRGGCVEIRMLPPVSTVVARLRELQPGLRKLAVPWTAANVGADLQSSVEAVRQLGVELVVVRVPEAAALPDRLRALPRDIEALWLPPDPLLVNEFTFSLCREFTAANGAAFYAPTEGLVEKGAVAAVSASYEEIGYAAARAAEGALSGKVGPQTVYPRTSFVAVNLAAAAQAGIEVPADVLRRVDRVIR